MKFYNRTDEIRLLQRTKEQAYNDHSKFMVLTGRRRVGKTSKKRCRRVFLIVQ
jgi:AAA+ ATPase superfamily predicted ATPase